MRKSNKAKHKKIPIFYALPIFVILSGLPISAFMMILMCLISVVANGYFINTNIETLIIFLFVSIGILYIILYPIYRFKYRDIFAEKKDRKKNGYYEIVAILHESKPYSKCRLNFMDMLLDYFLFMKKAAYHRCYFHVLDVNSIGSNDYFIYINTPEKNLLLNKLYKTENGYSKNKILYSGNLPLKIIYGAKSRMIFRIDAVDDYSYTDVELSAISQLNRMFLHDSGKRKEKISFRPAAWMPVYLLLFIIAFVFH